jgi:phytoene dehydrogenase-like protein
MDSLILGPQHNGMIVIAPSIEYLHKAWEDGQRGMVSKDPVLTMCIQTVTDKTLAPPGQHVLSVFVQYTPYNLKSTMWDDERPALIETVIAKIEEYAPNIRGIIEDVRVFTPKDLETTFSLTRGQAEHGDMTPDQIFAKRPVPGWAHYRTPIDGLLLCGSGAHPGGTVTGVPGRNAAKILLQDLSA